MGDVGEKGRKLPQSYFACALSGEGREVCRGFDERFVCIQRMVMGEQLLVLLPGQ
jgi:hypothetical protein